ncbi:protein STRICTOSIDINE SYNTHASE-LIKE 5-like isoform X1 [Salvia splendens]|uniref:protein STRICTOSIDINE SYNTHASE-LIKE 5-like isoform X1 n=1 Tax=Salvia splendens TaxID=180675 RepID=UPI001C27B0A3|nr:protein STRICTOSIDINE SYNTHASE-LIKE 5-like isoform X1 [Salvia splendens]
MASIVPLPYAVAAVAVLAAALLYSFATFDPAVFPEHELALVAPKQNDRMLSGSERIGEGELVSPEDIAYDPQTGLIYTGGEDGWISKVAFKDSAAQSVVEKWVNTGGRPLGIAHGLHGEVIVADAFKGLLNISRDGAIQVLTDEAEGLKFKFTDAVDIGPDGKLYFTDASYKYDVDHAFLELMEGRPHGRFLSYDPSTKKTTILLKDLYFANGVTLSADHTFVIVCETVMMRCKKYYIQGPQAGSVEIFIDNLPGLPDNIRYDGHGLYWIALATDSSFSKMLRQRPWIRKVIVTLDKYGLRPKTERNGGTIAVNLEGKAVAHYYDADVSYVTCCNKLSHYLYCGSLISPYITRLDLTLFPATATATATTTPPS